MIVLDAGFYAIEWERQKWKDLVQKLMEEGKLRKAPERMGMITLVRKLRQREKLPESILVLNFDRAMYEVFWLNGGEGNEKAAQDVVKKVVREFRSIFAHEREFLISQYPVILTVFGSLESTAEGWWAGYRHPRTKQVQRLFMVSQLLPSLLEPREILSGHLGCYGRF